LASNRTPQQTAAIRASFGVGIAVAAYGVSFGALAVASGLDIWQTCALSLLMFTGGSQFALVGVLAAGGAGPAAIASSTLVATRLTLYSMRVGPIVGGPWPKKLLAAHWTIDESTAVAIAQPTLPAQRTGFWWTAVIIYLGWNLTTLLGALLGDLLGDVRAYGLDAAAAAAFLGLIWPRLRQLQPIVVAIAAAVVAGVLLPVLPPGIPVLAAAAVALIVGLTNWLGPKPDAREADPGVEDAP
jgi:predicted branched-subunit amino acid permease